MVVLGLIALMLWFGWFFFAQILIYTNNQPATLRSDTQATALFPLGEAARLHPGQPARFQLDGLDASGPLAGRVSAVSQTAQGLQVTVDLQPTSNFSFRLLSSMPGKITVEVEELSPAALVLRSLGVAPTGQLISENYED